MRVGILGALLAVTLSAQTVQIRVYSEFQRVDPFGEILAADRAQSPREILSPAVVRNAFASFHVVVTAPANESYFLATQANPENILRWTLYEERFAKHGGAWIPDALEEARPPYYGVIPDPQMSIPGQTTRVYLLDVWVPRDAPVGKVRLEALAKVGYWRVAPMEVRVLPAVVPDLPAVSEPGALPPLEQPASAAAWGDLRAVSGEPSVRSVIRRNALQDLALAHQVQIAPASLQAIADGAPKTGGAEWYLKVRDYIYREASKRP